MIPVYAYLIGSAAYSCAYAVYCARSKQSVIGPAVMTLAPLAALAALIVVK